MSVTDTDSRVDAIHEERIELLETRIVELIHENDDLRSELNKTNRTLLLSKQTYTVDVVAEMLWARGFVSDEPTATVVYEYGWNHPDWFRNGVQTAEGAQYVRLGANGLLFTHDGVANVIEQFVGGQS